MCTMWILLIFAGLCLPSHIRASRYSLAQTRRVGFGPGRQDVLWEYDKASDFSRFFVSGTNCFLELHKNRSAHQNVARAVVETGALDSDLFFVNIYDNTSMPDKLIGGFVSIKASSISEFKFLPFRMEDIDNILTFTTPEKEPKQDFPIVDVPVPIPLGCIPGVGKNRLLFDPTALKLPNDLHGNRDKFTHRVKDLPPHVVDLFTTVLFSLVSHNREVKHTDLLDICTLTTWPPEAPFVLDRCCRIQNRLVYETTFGDVEVRCTYPDHVRGVLDIIATCLAVLFTVISPLFLSWIPGIPRWKNGGNIQKKMGDVESTAESSGSTTKGNNNMCIEEIHQHAPIASSDEDEDEVTELKTVDTSHTSLTSSAGSEESTIKKSMTSSDDSATDERRIFLNSDPELRFSPSLVLGYVALMHIDHRAVIITRRFLFLFICNILIGYVACVCYLYYPSVLSNSVFYSQAEFIKRTLQTLYNYQFEKYKYGDPDTIFVSLVLLTMVFIFPLLISITQMLFLFFILVQPKDVCQLLTWKENGQFFCKVLPERLRYTDSGEEDVTEGFQHLVYKKMIARMTCLTRSSFWKFWCHECFCKNLPECGRQGNGVGYCAICRKFLSAVKYVCFVLVHLVELVIFTLPMTSVLTNIFRQPHKILVSKTCSGKGRRYPFILWLTFPMTLAGLALTYLLVLNFSLFYAEAMVFFLIDILRNSEKTLPSIIFVVSLLVYMRMAFVQFEDDYRRLKVKVIQMCEDMNREAEQRGSYIFYKETPTTELLLVSKAGEVSIPRDLFYKVANTFMPYKVKVVRTLLELAATLGMVAFLFYVALQFQFFHTFTAVGETFLTGIMVSVPRLLGMLKSAAYLELRENQRDRAVEAFISAHVLVEDRPAKSNYVP